MICDDCLHKLSSSAPGCCPVCGRPVFGGAGHAQHCRASSISRTRVLGPYAPPFSSLIQALKYQDKTALARPLGEALAALVESDPELARADCVCPVPLHPARRRERGYNQSELLAREVASSSGKEFLELLVRRRNTPTQTRKMDHSERKRNLKGAFVARPGTSAAGRAVIIVDDVTTSGATLDAAGRSLLLDGASALYGLAVAGA